MKTTHYTLDFADGRTSNYSWTDEPSAWRAVEGIIPGCVFADDWDDLSPDSSRLLVWANERDAKDDFGSKAIAQLVRNIPA